MLRSQRDERRDLATIGTIVATLAFLIVPGLVYTWYALEHIIGDKKSYARVTAEIDR